MTSPFIEGGLFKLLIGDGECGKLLVDSSERTIPLLLVLKHTLQSVPPFNFDCVLPQLVQYGIAY